jgi:CDP-glucose 4,6-dehydratase
MKNILSNFFKNKTVLVTGHTGFKGSWLIAWLKILGANVVGLSLDPPTTPSHFVAACLHKDIVDLRIDIRDNEALKNSIIETQPDFIFHLAAQSLVRKSYSSPIETWTTNLNGTMNLLESLRALKNDCSAVIITSDKCYENVEWVWGYRETDSLGGLDPYSASKGATELLIRSFIKSFFPPTSNVRIASARAGNVIGGGDWANSRIIPDCVRAWSAGTEVTLRNPNSTRPWQHVLEPLSGYITLAMHLNRTSNFHGESFNFGPSSHQNHSVLELVSLMGNQWDKANWRDISKSIEEPYESGLLKLNCDKALHQLNWHEVMDFEDTVNMTIEWYKIFYQTPEKIFDVTKSQIVKYHTLANEKGLPWAS